MADLEDIQDATKNLQNTMRDLAKGPMTEVRDLAQQVRENFLDAESHANLKITKEDILARHAGKLTAVQAGYELITDKIEKYHFQLNGINDTNDLAAKALGLQNELDATKTEALADHALLVKDVADLTRDLQELELMRDSIPKGSAEYAELAEKIKQTGVDLINQESTMKATKSQIQAMAHLHDGYLGSIVEAQSRGASINEITLMRRKMYREELNLSESQIEALERQQKTIAGMGKGLDDYIKKGGLLGDETMQSIEETKENMLNFAASIPFVGRTIERSMRQPLEDAAEKMREGFVDFNAGMRESMEAGDSYAVAMTKNIGKVAKGFGGMAKGILSAFMGPWALVGLFVGLLIAAWKLIGKMEEATRDMRLEWGAFAQDVQPIGDHVKKLGKEFVGYGATFKDFATAAVALEDTFSNMTNITEDQIKLVGLLETQTGVAAATSAEALDTFMKLGDIAAGAAEDRIGELQNLAKRHGVNFKKVMNDLANVSDDLLVTFRGSTKELAKSAVMARRMGTDINKLAGSARKLLDFETSLTDQMKLSTMFGRMVNMDKLRALALAGDLEGVAKEQLRIAESLGGLDNMSIWQKEALAEAMGVEYGTLLEMQKTKRRDIELQAAANRGDLKAKAILEHRAALKKKADDEENMSTVERLHMQMKEQQALEKKKAMQDKWNELLMQVSDILLPLALRNMEDILRWMTELNKDGSKLNEKLGHMIDLVKFLMIPFEVIYGIFAALNGDFDMLKSKFSSLTEIGKTLSAVFLGLFIMFRGNIPFISKGLSTLGGKMKDMIKSRLGMGGGPAGGSPGAPATPTPESTQPTQQAGGAANKFNKIKMGKVLKAAAAMLILAAALWVLAKALQEFNTVNWTSLGKGALALLGMVTSLWIMSKIMDKAKKKILVGAAAMVIMAGAMWVVGKALQQFNDVDWEAAVIGMGSMLVMTGVLAALGKAVKKFGADIFLGILGIVALAAAMAIAALAFQEFNGIDWVSVWIGIGTIVLLTAAMFGLGALLAGPQGLLFVAGVIAIAALGVALIPFAFAASLAASAMDQIADAFIKMAMAFKDLAWEDIGKIAVMGLMFAGFGLMIGFITLGAIAMVLMAGALTLLGLALEFCAPGLDALGNFLLTSSEAFNSMIDGLVRLGEMGSSLFTAALGIAAVGAALAALGVGSAIGGVVGAVGGVVSGAINKIGGFFGLVDEEKAKEDPLDRMLKIADRAEELQTAADAINSLADLSGLSTDMGEGIEAVADGIGSLAWSMIWAGDIFEDMDIESLSAMISQLTELAPYSDQLLQAAEGISAIGGALGNFAVGKQAVTGGGGGLFGWLGLGEGEEEPLDIFEPLLELAQHGEGLEKAAAAITSLSDMGEIQEGVGEALSSIAGGIGDLAWSMLMFNAFAEDGAEQFGFLTTLMESFVGLGQHSEQLIVAAEGISAIGGALQTLASGRLANELADIAGSFMNFFSAKSEEQDIFAKLIDLSGHGPGLVMVADAVERLSGGDVFQKLLEVGEHADGLFTAASGIHAIASALYHVQSAMTFGDLFSSMFGFGGEVTTGISLDEFIELGKVGDKLGMAATGIKQILSLDPKDAEGISAMGPALRSFTESLGFLDPASAANLPALGQGVDMLVSAFSNNPLGDLTDSVGDLLVDISHGLVELFAALDGTSSSALRAFPSVGDGMDNLLRALARSIGSVRLGTGAILAELGGGLRTFLHAFKGMSKRHTDELPGIGKGLSVLLKSMSGDLQRVPPNVGQLLARLGEGIYDFFDELSGVDTDSLEFIDVMANSFAPMVTQLVEADISQLADVGKTLEGLGEGLHELADYIDDGEIDTLTKLATSLTPIIPVFKSLQTLSENAAPLINLGDVIKGMTEGIKDMPAGDVEKIMKITESIKTAMDPLSSLKVPADLPENIGNSLGAIINQVKQIAKDSWAITDIDVEQIKKVGSVIGDVLTPLSKIKIPDAIGKVITSLAAGVKEMVNSVADLPEENITKMMQMVSTATLAMSPLTRLEVDENVGTVISELLTKLSAVTPEELEHIVSLGVSLRGVVSAVSLDGVNNVLQLFKGLNSFAQEDFAEGLTRATKAILEFVKALGTIPEEQIELFGKLATIGGTAETDGGAPTEIPISEVVGNQGLGEFFKDRGVSKATWTDKEKTGTDSHQRRDELNAQVAKNLTNLVELLRSGGIAVNLDGKKVNKELGRAVDKSN